MTSLSYPDAPGFKAPGTSAEAAPDTKNAGLLREQCLMMLQYRDLTADECAKVLRKSILSIRPRFSELAARGDIWPVLVRDALTNQVVHLTRQNDSGKAATVWTTKRQPELL